MEKLVNFQVLVATLLVAIAIIVAEVNGQSSTICTGAMVQSFIPCTDFLTSGSNASSPSSDCCRSLRNLVGYGQDCLCFIITGGVPFKIPINRSLAISLPRDCRMSGVAVECKGSPGENGSNLSPSLSPPSSRVPLIPWPLAPPSVPEGDTTPPLAPEGDLVPTLTPPGMRPTLIPSAADGSPNVLTSILVTGLCVIVMKCF